MKRNFTNLYFLSLIKFLNQKNLWLQKEIKHKVPKTIIFYINSVQKPHKFQLFGYTYFFTTKSSMIQKKEEVFN